MNKPSTWTKTIVASMTSYIDAGSIVAGAAGLALWKEYLQMGDWQLGLLGACSSNALSAAIGALIGGRICDLYGRKLVYTYDLLFYIIGMLLIVFGVNYQMLLIGYIIVGLSVGADVAASWTLIAENAPAENRARHCGTAQLMWALGPAVVLLLSAVLEWQLHLGVFGNRLVFGHLVVIAFVTWLMRLRMPESEEWITNKQKEKELIASGVWQKTSYWDLFTNKTNLRGILLLIGVYMIWNLAAGTGGFFLPYIYENAGSVKIEASQELNSNNETKIIKNEDVSKEASQELNLNNKTKKGGLSKETSLALSALVFITSCFATFFIFMKLADRFSRRLIYFVVASLYIVAWGLFMLPKEYLGIGLFVITSILMGINNGSGQQAFYQMWGAEIFPARYRAAAQGFSFFSARFFLSIWSFFVPIIIGKNGEGLPIVAVILVIFATISMLIGTIFCPNTSGKTLDQIEKERYG
ncbi:MAG: MFS transporter [Planctomycetaceae bacterium]|jgi:inositol transporter-like SP family MFS transporter|nr:MFS transporter [Planctomycetaceae bacterium]